MNTNVTPTITRVRGASAHRSHPHGKVVNFNGYKLGQMLPPSQRNKVPGYENIEIFVYVTTSVVQAEGLSGNSLLPISHRGGASLQFSDFSAHHKNLSVRYRNVTHNENLEMLVLGDDGVQVIKIIGIEGDWLLEVGEAQGLHPFQEFAFYGRGGDNVINYALNEFTLG